MTLSWLHCVVTERGLYLNIWHKFAIQLGSIYAVEARSPRLRKSLFDLTCALSWRLVNSLSLEDIITELLVVLPALHLAVVVMEPRNIWETVVHLMRWRRAPHTMMILINVHKVMPSELTELGHLQIVLPEQLLHEVWAVIQTAITLLMCVVWVVSGKLLNIRLLRHMILLLDC